jgi:hypothetical protein
VDAARLPAFSGSTLRGAFGFALKRAVCVMSHRDCPRCLVRSRCIYPYVFETSAPADSKLAHQQNAPHPFTLDPPAGAWEEERQGDRERGRGGEGETGGQGDRETGGQGDRETGRQGDRETGRQGDRQGFCKVSEVTPKSAPALCRCSRHSDDEHLPHCPSHCGK